jgi:hypothetical protein
MFIFHISQALLLYKSCTIIMKEEKIKEWIQRFNKYDSCGMNALNNHSDQILINKISLDYFIITSVADIQEVYPTPPTHKTFTDTEIACWKTGGQIIYPILHQKWKDCHIYAIVGIQLMGHFCASTQVTNL